MGEIATMLLGSVSSYDAVKFGRWCGEASLLAVGYTRFLENGILCVGLIRMSRIAMEETGWLFTALIPYYAVYLKVAK